MINFIHEHSPMHHQVLSIQPITCVIDSIDATQNSFVLNFTQISKYIDVITLIYAYRIAFFLITKSSTNRVFIHSIFIVNIYLKFCFIHVVKFHLFENYSLIFTPLLFSHLFFFSPSPLLPLFPYYLVIWWQILANLWKYLNVLGGFPWFLQVQQIFWFWPI